MERETLYTRINRRVEAMIDEGLRAEVESLLARGYPPELKPMQAIGYRHMVDFLSGRTPWDAAIALMKRDTRRYAKRQFTWFRADPAIVWTTPEAVEDLVPDIEQFLQTGNVP
jgi:tRNA dimethylallyltransferase